MKKLFLSVFAIAALASCMQDETLGAAQRENIVFENAFVDNTTKAIDPSITTTGENAISTFQVWGTTQGDHTNAAIVPIFANETVEKDDNGVWGYADNKTQYWIDGNVYNFSAVVNGTATLGVNGLPATINYVASSGKDLLFATYGPYEAEENNNPKVDFTFAHLLSKAVFTFENTTPEGNVNSPANIYEVTNIQISGLDANADYDVTANAWTNNTSGDFTLNFGDIVAADANSVVSAAPIAEGESGKSNYEHLLIPGTHNVTITCKITLYNGYVDESRIVDVINYNKTLDITFQKGVAYNLNLKAGLKQAIEFKVTAVESWNDPYVETNVPEQGHDNTPDQNINNGNN